MVSSLYMYLIKNQSNIQLMDVHSVVSFLALALAFVSLTFNSFALCTIRSLYKSILAYDQPYINELDFGKKCDTLNYLPFVCGNVLSNFTAENSVVHQENFNISFIGNKDLLETVWKEMSGLMILFVTDEHLFSLSTSKSSSGRAINTSNSSVAIWL